MVKDSGSTREVSRDSPAKKRRKEEPTGTTKISSSGITKVTSNDTNIYKQVIEYEEAEALERDPEEDLKLYNETCAEFRKLMAEISEMKGSTKHQGEISEKRIQASLLFVTLKKLNRLEKFRTKHSRDVLHKVKQQVDSQHLHLQNLLYEVLHLKKEVTKCLQFKSKDEEIDLVPVEEFYKDAPETVSRPSQTSVDAHQLKLARLEWELKQRKQLAAQCHELHAEKETVATEIQKKRAHIENLAPMLKDILSVTKPVQENLGFSGISRIHKQPETAYLLPHPLYYLYVQASAHREAFDNQNMTVVVNGDEEEAQRMRRTISNKSNQNDHDDSDSDNQEEGSKRHHRKKSRSDRQEERKKQLLAKHPLSVNISITLKSSGSSIHLTFWYLMNLHIVSVKVKVVLFKAQNSNCGSHLVSGDTILSGLYPDDLGLDSPNVANYYQLKQVGMDSYNSKELGLAYLWAQRVCGFDFATADKDGNVEPKCTVSQANLPGVLKAIKNRLQARTALSKQVQALETRMIPENPQLSSLFAPKLNGFVELWQPSICSDFVVLPYTSHLVKIISPTESDIFYKAIFSRGSAKLHAAIILKSDYPSSKPVFALQIQTNGRKYNISNSEAIRDMEREVNYYCRELCAIPTLSDWILTGQVLQLLSCFDIFLEALVNSEFPREKIFLQPVRGKTRALPYKYMKIGEGIFTQH